MPAISAIFLVAALALAVVIGPQTRPWSWGPAILMLGISVLAALPVFWKRAKQPSDLGMLALGTLTAGWFAWRAWISPVAELGQADLLLIVTAVGAYLCVRAIAGNQTAEKILTWGIGLLLLANLAVIGLQLVDPTYTPVFRTRAADKMISGFFAHYNEAANYLIVSAMMVGAAALFGRHATATRIVWLLIAIAALAGVWFTRSRGGIFGAAVACGVFATVALTIARRTGSRWFVPALVAIPLIGLGIGAFLLMGWQQAQELRSAEGGISELLDDNCRLYFLGIAFSCICLHPLAGGGGRSFSWECFRFVDAAAQGETTTHKPEFVHNEIVQSAADYGLIGAGLLLGFFGALAITAILRVLFDEKQDSRDSRNVWHLGALAGLTGMFVQSCFSFVFHLLPGVLLLGICLGMMSKSPETTTAPRTLGTRILLALAAVFCAALLLPSGWKGLQVTRILWQTYFSKVPATSAESRIDALTDAIRIWPQSSFYQERATIFQTLAGPEESPEFTKYAGLAIENYQDAARLHPLDPGLAVNRANVLSQLNQDDEAEAWYAKAIELQGGMEVGFRGHFSLANHYLRVGRKRFESKDPEAAHQIIERAADQIETSIKKTHWVIVEAYEPRITIHEILGFSREAVGDRKGALDAYNFASTLPGGERAHYRAAVLFGKIAAEEWSARRPAEAMKHFIEARKRLTQAADKLPHGITLGQSAEFTRYLDERIAFLNSAKVKPAE